MKNLTAAALVASATLASAQAPVVGAYVLNERPVEVVDALPVGKVTHVLYAFLRLCGPGQLPADAAGCQGKADYAVAEHPEHSRFHAAFERLKARDAKVKLLASVGGWGGSDPFFHLAATPAGRAALVAGAQALLRTHPAFDGLDIDWEHPGNNGAVNGVALGSAADGEHYVALMADLRAGLTALGSETGRRYLLTTAINPSKQQMARIPMARAARSLDLVFLMTYDFYGNWSTRAGHHTALRGPVSGDDSVEASVANLRRAGVPARQLVAGVAMYGRGFEGVQADGSFKAPWPAPDGAVAYRDLAALPGVKPRFDTRTQSWALVGEGGRFVGYDDPRTVRAKAAFVRQRGLAGLFAWELGQDNGEILNAMQP